jgi:hypothetical protein
MSRYGGGGVRDVVTRVEGCLATDAGTRSGSPSGLAMKSRMQFDAREHRGLDRLLRTGHGDGRELPVGQLLCFEHDRAAVSCRASLAGRHARTLAGPKG